MYFEFSSILIYVGVAAVFLFMALTIPRLVRWIFKLNLKPENPYSSKLLPYECGEEAVGTAYIQFNIRFYFVAIVFLIFEVEIALLIPWVYVFNDGGLLALIEIFLFVGILIAGFAYAWARGDLEWVKTLSAESENKG